MINGPLTSETFFSSRHIFRHYFPLFSWTAPLVTSLLSRLFRKPLSEHNSFTVCPDSVSAVLLPVRGPFSEGGVRIGRITRHRKRMDPLMAQTSRTTIYKPQPSHKYVVVFFGSSYTLPQTTLPYINLKMLESFKSVKVGSSDYTTFTTRQVHSPC